MYCTNVTNNLKEVQLTISTILYKLQTTCTTGLH